MNFVESDRRRGRPRLAGSARLRRHPRPRHRCRRTRRRAHRSELPRRGAGAALAAGACAPESRLPLEALEDAFRKLTRADAPSLVERNRALHRMLVDGVTVEYRRKDGSIAGAQARVIDFDDPDNNDWLAVNQFTVAEGQHIRRPDMVLFVNGLPLAVIELKNPADENATIWTASSSSRPTRRRFPSLFATNAALVVSDGVQARIGTLGAGKEWFKPWRTIGGEKLRRLACRNCRSSSRASSRSGGFST